MWGQPLIYHFSKYDNTAIKKLYTDICTLVNVQKTVRIQNIVTHLVNVSYQWTIRIT